MRFTDGSGYFYLIGPAIGCMRPGVLDGTDRQGEDLCALPTQLEGLDEDAREYLRHAVIAYQRAL